MIRHRLSTLALSLLCLTGAVAPMVVAAPTVAHAQADLSAAKGAGQVGERPDGLLGVVDPAAPADIQALVNRVNAERTAQYRDVAQRTGQDLAKVQAVAGDRLVQATPAGQFVMNAAGRWVRK